VLLELAKIGQTRLRPLRMYVYVSSNTGEREVYNKQVNTLHGRLFWSWKFAFCHI